MVLITIVTGAYKPTYNWRASHCIHGRLASMATLGAGKIDPIEALGPTLDDGFQT